MEGSFECDAEDGLCDERQPLNERERLIGRDPIVNLHMRRLSVPEVDGSPSPPEHMLPAARNEGDADNGQSSSPEMSSSHEPSTSSVHCHGPVSPTDPVARNQLIAISVLCFVFMIAEVVGERRDCSDTTELLKKHYLNFWTKSIGPFNIYPPYWICFYNVFYTYDELYYEDFTSAT